MIQVVVRKDGNIETKIVKSKEEFFEMCDTLYKGSERNNIKSTMLILTFVVPFEKFVEDVPWLFRPDVSVERAVVQYSISIETPSKGKYLNWYSGIWHNGIWENVNWYFGRWYNGIWKDGIWKDGWWYEGIWEKGYWTNGVWYNGIWKDGIKGNMMIGSNK